MMVPTGQHNVLIGCRAGQYITSGNYNVALGADTLADVTTESYQVQIGWYRLPNPKTPLGWWKRRRLCRTVERALYDWVRNLR